jgi:hypothetical protein
MTPEESTKQQWAALVSLLEAQLGPNGTLPTVASVQPSVDLFTHQTPAVGVQLVRTSYDLKFTKKQQVTASFVVLVSVQSQPDNAFGSPPNLADAMDRLQTIIDDGQGNGVSPTLRDPANITLSGLAALMLITGVDYSWESVAAPPDRRRCGDTRLSL